MISVLSVLGQEKHVTFMDSLTPPPSSSYYNNFYITKTPMYNGYFLGAGFDDMSYEMKHYIAKTDFEGTLLWDSIYYFQEPFNQGGGSSYMYLSPAGNGVIGYTEASGVNPNNNAQPFIYYVNEFGQIDWNSYYSVDSINVSLLDVEQTNDNGYVLTGVVNDWSGFSGLSFQYGYLYKVDVSGVVEWSKWYANKDTIEFGFNSVAQTSNGDYIVAGQAANNKMGGGKGTPGTWENFMNVMMVDANGDVVWNNALYFDTIVDNSSYFDEAQVNILDDQTALVTFKFYDTLNYYYDLGIASYNIADGNVNWVKGYTLAVDAVDFNYRKTVILNNGHIVVWHDDYGDGARSILYEFDNQGNIVQSVSISDIMNNVYYQDLIATEDGGLMVSAYPNSGAGTRLFKTDKNILTHCGTENIFNDPELLDLTYTTYSIVDTVFDVTLNTGTLSVVADSIVDFGQGNYCGCELYISGNIVEPNMGAAADSVLVTLYRYDPMPGQYVVHDTITTDASGGYIFEYLPAGNYVVKAEPSQSKYPNLVKTYFNNTINATQWDSAEVIMVQCGINPMTYNFTLVQGVSQSGTWTCNGYVYQYYGYEPTNKKAPGDPIGDIDITVEQSPGGAISSTTTDPQGYYEFTGLNNNATFIVRADIPGLPNDSIYTLTVNPGDAALDSLNFYVDSVGVYILAEDLFTGVTTKFGDKVDFKLVPNPTNGQVSLFINLESSESLDIRVVNVMGENVFAKQYIANKGNNKIQLDLSDFSQGIYFVRISQGENYLIRKLIKQ